MIEIKNVSKTYKTKDGCVTALSDVDLKIESGDIFGILGISGAGKSTLIRCINELEKPDFGEVLIQGANITKMKGKELLAERKKKGMIFQHFNLFEQSTVYENAAYPLKLA